MHIDDQHHLANVALVCRSLRGLAQEILSCRNRCADTPESLRALCGNATTSRRFANMVRHLTVRCHFDLDDALIQALTPALRAFQNLDVLVLDIPAFHCAEKCVQHGLLDARLSTLTTLHTTLYVSSQLLEFIAAHSSLTELSLLTRKSEEAITDASRPQIILPSLRKLGCDGSFLHYFRNACTPSELHLVTCTVDQLEIASTAFGPYLRRLHFSHVRTADHRPHWTLQYFMSSRFPCLEYLQTCVNDTVDAVRPHYLVVRALAYFTSTQCDVIDWRSNPTPPLRCNRSTRLTVAWILSPKLYESPNWLHELLHSDALHVLRTWAPYVDQVVFGSGPKLVAAATLSRDRTSLVRRELEDAQGGKPDTPWFIPFPK